MKKKLGAQKCRANGKKRQETLAKKSRDLTNVLCSRTRALRRREQSKKTKRLGVQVSSNSRDANLSLIKECKVESGEKSKGSHIGNESKTADGRYTLLI